MSRSFGCDGISSGNNHDGQGRQCEDHIQTYAKDHFKTDAESSHLTSFETLNVPPRFFANGLIFGCA